MSTKKKKIRILLSQTLLGTPVFMFWSFLSAVLGLFLWLPVSTFHLSSCFIDIINISPIKIGLSLWVIYYWKPFSLTSRAWGRNMFIFDRSWYFSMSHRHLSKSFFFPPYKNKMNYKNGDFLN